MISRVCVDVNADGRTLKITWKETCFSFFFEERKRGLCVLKEKLAPNLSKQIATRSRVHEMSSLVPRPAVHLAGRKCSEAERRYFTAILLCNECVHPFDWTLSLHTSLTSSYSFRLNIIASRNKKKKPNSIRLNSSQIFLFKLIDQMHYYIDAMILVTQRRSEWKYYSNCNNEKIINVQISSKVIIIVCLNRRTARARVKEEAETWIHRRWSFENKRFEWEFKLMRIKCFVSMAIGGWTISSIFWNCECHSHDSMSDQYCL